MPDLLLFVEDGAQEKFLITLLERIASEKEVSLSIRVRTARGGYPRVLGQLKDFVREIERGRDRLPDGIVVGIDANCKGYNERRKAVLEGAGKFAERVVCAIPDPHIERWFLLDGEAFKTAVGKGCNPPDEKCEKERYKRLLNNAVLNAGVQPLLGGVEYAEDIVNEYHVQKIADTDHSFGHFVADFRTWLNRQKKF